MVDRSFWEKAAAAGFVGFEAPAAYGGLDVRDFRFNAVIDEEMMYASAVGDGFGMANDIMVPYLLDLTDDDQKSRWLPGFTSGALIAAVAMTEPQAGSDLRGIAATAVRDGDCYIVNGTKTFITSGLQADLVVTVVRDDEAGGRLTLLAVERNTPGFERGRKLSKVGHRGPGHQRAVLQRRPRALRQPVGPARRGSRPPEAEPAPGAAVHGRDRGGRSREGPADHHRVLPGAPSLRTAGGQPPSQPVHHRRDAGRGGPRALPRRPLHPGPRRRRVDRGGGRRGEAHRQRTAVPGGRPVPAAAWRLRVHGRIPDLALVERRTGCSAFMAGPARS